MQATEIHFKERDLQTYEFGLCVNTVSVPLSRAFFKTETKIGKPNEKTSRMRAVGIKLQGGKKGKNAWKKCDKKM